MSWPLDEQISMYKKARSLGDQALLSEESFIRIPDDQTMVSDMDICFPCRGGHTYPLGYCRAPVVISAVSSFGLASRNKKPRNLLRGLCFIDIVYIYSIAKHAPRSV